MLFINLLFMFRGFVLCYVRVECWVGYSLVCKEFIVWYIFMGCDLGCNGGSGERNIVKCEKCEVKAGFFIVRIG